MSNRILLVITMMATLWARADDDQLTRTGTIQTRSDWYDFTDAETNGLQPRVTFSREGADWSFEIDYKALTNFPANSWLSITNRCGSKLELWLNDGVKAQIKDQTALAAMSLPTQTTVANIMRGSARPRILQWLRFGSRSPVAGETAAVTTFNLSQAFDIAFTNDVTLQITPLLYRVDSNIQTARLIEFPPMRLKLFSNGDVKKE